MGARHELNEVHLLGAITLAGLLGLATGSWAVFGLAGAVLIGTAMHAGKIRGPRRKR